MKKADRKLWRRPERGEKKKTSTWTSAFRFAVSSCSFSFDLQAFVFFPSTPPPVEPAGPLPPLQSERRRRRRRNPSAKPRPRRDRRREKGAELRPSHSSLRVSPFGRRVSDPVGLADRGVGVLLLWGEIMKANREKRGGGKRKVSELLSNLKKKTRPEKKRKEKTSKTNAPSSSPPPRPRPAAAPPAAAPRTPSRTRPRRGRWPRPRAWLWRS